LTSAGFDDLQNFHEAEKHSECTLAQTFRERRLQLFGKNRTEYCMGNQCHLVQNLLSFGLLSRNTKNKIYRTISLPVLLYGCETWSLTLREERKLRVFENRLLRRIFGPKRDKVTGEW
jgi:hypothetical protein